MQYVTIHTLTCEVLLLVVYAEQTMPHVMMRTVSLSGAPSCESDCVLGVQRLHVTQSPADCCHSL